MYFPVADIACPPLLPFAAAMGISFFTSMGGISGAFLLLPFQVSVLGYTNPGVSATNQVFNVLACPAGVWRYWREGRQVWPLSLTVILGTLPGVVLGAIARVTLLADPRRFQVFAGLVLFYMSGRMAFSLWRNRGGGEHGQNARSIMSRCCDLTWSMRQCSFVFREKRHVVSTPALLLLSLAIGLVGGMYGIGGGAIMAPFLVSFFGLPVHAVAGATLLATCVTSLAGVLCYAALGAWYADAVPDCLLGLLLGLGGMCGMYAGARCQKYVPARAVQGLLAVLLALLALRYAG